MPWVEQAHNIAAVMAQAGYLMVEEAKEKNLTEVEINVLMLGTLPTAFTPVESTASPYKPQLDETSDRYFARLRFSTA